MVVGDTEPPFDSVTARPEGGDWAPELRSVWHNEGYGDFEFPVSRTGSCG